jgi:hypothetical protein
MKKNTILLLVIFSLLALPVVPAAATEFTLGGYIKMEVIWDSTQTNKWLYYGMARDNDPNFHHGRLKFSSSNSRMWFTIKGPKLWGAQTTGYIEWDFDNKGDINAGASTNIGWASENKSRLGLRHCFFRLNWPETELMMGNYWSVMTEEVPETANFGASTTAGFPFLREPQIRLTQMFGLGGGKMTASVAVAGATNGMWGLSINGTQSTSNPYGGESSETPRVEGRVKYDIDLWGKAAFWGVPRPFSVRVGASWMKERFRTFSSTTGRYFDGGFHGCDYGTTNVAQRDQQYLDHWLVEGSVFIPLIPTQTANLAGTASLLTQWFVGAGLYDFFEDTPANGSYLTFDHWDGTYAVGDRTLMQRFGGFVQLQYYFTNQWYVQGVWGFNRAFNVDRCNWIGDTTSNDPVRTNQHFYGTLWYRPIKALKFGLEYTYVRTDYFQIRTATAGSCYNPSDLGQNHRVMFCGFFYF